MTGFFFPSWFMPFTFFFQWCLFLFNNDVPTIKSDVCNSLQVFMLAAGYLFFFCCRLSTPIFVPPPVVRGFRDACVWTTRWSCIDLEASHRGMKIRTFCLAWIPKNSVAKKVTCHTPNINYERNPGWKNGMDMIWMDKDWYSFFFFFFFFGVCSSVETKFGKTNVLRNEKNASMEPFSEVLWVEATPWNSRSGWSGWKVVRMVRAIWYPWQANEKMT